MKSITDIRSHKDGMRVVKDNFERVTEGLAVLNEVGSGMDNKTRLATLQQLARDCSNIHTDLLDEHFRNLDAVITFAKYLAKIMYLEQQHREAKNAQRQRVVSDLRG